MHSMYPQTLSGTLVTRQPHRVYGGESHFTNKRICVPQIGELEAHTPRGFEYH